ncbi:NADH dehydrogenase [Platysternon megacephalum]|uniref:NADH dehydrogenase n=1 Tax=Platysternon megacephalum TaxID=55544 RepID=A0A4D9EBR4_9SAUR|nr:NADH dehydrogenase [Platysternon megacephalum]
MQIETKCRNKSLFNRSRAQKTLPSKPNVIQCLASDFKLSAAPGPSEALPGYAATKADPWSVATLFCGNGLTMLELQLHVTFPSQVKVCDTTIPDCAIELLGSGEFCGLRKRYITHVKGRHPGSQRRKGLKDVSMADCSLLEPNQKAGQGLCQKPKHN